MTSAEELELGGHDNWRLPNVRELQSLLNYGEYREGEPRSLIDPVFDREGAYFWSSTTYGLKPSQALFVHFHGGGVTIRDKTENCRVRAVRTIQPGE